MCSGKIGTAKTQGEARTASGSIGRSAALPLTATAALRFAPCRFPGNSTCRPAGAFCSLFSVLWSLFSGAPLAPLLLYYAQEIERWNRELHKPSPTSASCGRMGAFTWIRPQFCTNWCVTQRVPSISSPVRGVSASRSCSPRWSVSSEANASSSRGSPSISWTMTGRSIPSFISTSRDSKPRPWRHL